jgi:ribonuclease HI
MYFDGSLKLQGAGAGILFTAPGGEHLKYALQLLFPASNNAVEYEALIQGLSIAISLGVKRLMVYGDSLVVISQINKEWDCSSDSLGKYCTAVRKLEDKFEGLEFHHVERDRNTVIQSARYQQTLRRYHDKAVRRRSFAVGDLVLRRILTGEGRHKLSPLWEGPFIVAEVTRPGSYRLTQMDGTEIGNSWNIEHLKKFYP